MQEKQLPGCGAEPRQAGTASSPWATSPSSRTTGTPPARRLEAVITPCDEGAFTSPDGVVS